MRLMLLLALPGLLAGCGEDPVGVAAIPTQKKAWIGSYTDPSGQGDLVVDIAQTGSAVTGEIVFGSSGATFLRISGIMRSDSLLLALDPVYSSNPADFSLRARVLADGSLSGTMALASAGLNADLSCRVLERRAVDTDATHSVPYDVIAMVFDGSRLWLATTGNDYVRIDPDGTVLDTIVIYHDPLPAHWTSSALMFDGALLWGVYPITIIGPGGTSNVADLLAFTASGRSPDSLRIGHRPAGLAHDGVHSWSLRSDPKALIGLDGAGAVTDSLHLGIPDAIHLAFDGTRFWTLGWNLRRLYEVDPSGQVVAICDLPSPAPGTLPAGLAVQGSRVWYSEGTTGASVLRRVTIR